MEDSVKHLLKKQIYRRIPFGLKCYVQSTLFEEGGLADVLVISGDALEVQYLGCNCRSKVSINDAKLVLRPQKDAAIGEMLDLAVKYFGDYASPDTASGTDECAAKLKIRLESMETELDWYYACQYDTCGLLEKGLAVVLYQL